MIQASRVDFTDYIVPVCLPHSPVEDADRHAGRMVTLTGWGLRKRNDILPAGEHLRRTHFGIFSQRWEISNAFL